MVLSSVQDRIGYITLNRPEKRNALDAEMVIALTKAFTQAAEDPTVKVIILQANGDAFCAGADLGYLQQLQKNTYEENLADSRQLMKLFQLIYHLPKPVISKVKGPALAGGCGLATVCDFCYADSNSRFGYTEVKIGFVPAIVKVFLTRKLGETRTREWLLTGNIYSAQQAYEAGLITKVCEEQVLEEEVKNLAEQLCNQSSAQSMSFIKEMLAEIPSMPVNDALEYAARMNAKARGTDDCKKGIQAFLNKEKLSW